MAETVKQELERKLEGAVNALAEATTSMNRYKEEVGILETRISDLKIAIRAFAPMIPLPDISDSYLDLTQ